MLGHSDCDMRQTARTALVSVMLALALVFNTATSSSINVYPHVHNNKMPQINRATRVVHPNDMGVFKLQSSGPLVLANGTVVVVAAVTYLKTMPHADGQLELRAVSYMYDPLSAQPDLVLDKWSLHMLPVTHALNNVSTPPSFSIISLGGRPDANWSTAPLDIQRVTLSTVSPLHQLQDQAAQRYRFQSSLDYYKALLPFTMRTVLPNASNIQAQSWAFAVGACDPEKPQGQPCWEHKALLPHEAFVGPITPAHDYFRTKDSEAQFISIIKPLALVDIHSIAPMLAQRALHLTGLGFSKTVLYDRGTYMKHMQENELIQDLLAARRLEVMRFGHEQSGMPQPWQMHWNPLDKGAWQIDVDQWVVYTHAALCWWGTNTYLFLADLDEIPSTPPGVPLPALFSANGCLEGKLYAQLFRVQHMCGPAAEDALRRGGTMDEGALRAHHEAAAWVAAVAALANETPAVQELLSGLHAWMVCVAAELLEGSPAREGKPHVPYQTLPKVLVHADAGAHFHAHDGFVWPDAVDAATGHVDASCLSVVHLHNLMSSRPVIDIEYKVASNWTWPWAQLATRWLAHAGADAGQGVHTREGVGRPDVLAVLELLR